MTSSIRPELSPSVVCPHAHGIKNNIILTKLLCWTIYFEWRVIKVVCIAYSENSALAFISADWPDGTAGRRITERPPSRYYIIVATANNIIIILYRNGSRDTSPLVRGACPRKGSTATSTFVIIICDGK